MPRLELMIASSEKTSLWNNILEIIERRLNPQIFDSWFRPIAFAGIDEQSRVLKLRASQVNKDWVDSYYSNVILQTLDELSFSGFDLVWEIEDAANGNASGSPAAHKTSNIPETVPSFRKPVSEKTEDPPEYDLGQSSLNSKYTFDAYVVGECNKFAHAASKAVADAPGKTYNPMYIYGGVGLGKTHLMHAIGNSIKELNPALKIAYISSEKFMNELINAIRYDKTQNFRDKYRKIDVLLMDDIQFLAGKERTQEEFFHTFNALHNDQKQIVITSDCPPREIPTLEERLHSRFEWGLIADIEPPDLETKIAILERKAEQQGIELPNEVAFFMAGRVKNNIRELEGSLVRLSAIASLRGVPISKMLAQDAMRNILDDDRQADLSLGGITKAVADHYNLSVEDIKSKNNSRHIAVPRQVAMYLAKRLTKHSFPEIGREFGGKHHTTVMHSVEKIDALTRKDKDFHNLISTLIDNLCS